jgi:glutamine amidotransferase-like uncharacterized protein
VARITRSLLLLCILVTACTGPSGHDRPGEPTQLRVAIYDGFGTGAWGPLANAIEAMEDVNVAPIRPEEIRAGHLEKFDVVVFAGGMASHQFHALGADGRDRVRAFVRKGGGYVGICAGAFLAASAPYEWGMGLVDARIVDHEHWARGVGDVQVELTDPGQAILRGGPGSHVYRYANGPILAPANDPELPDYRTLAVFRTGIGEKGADPATMVGTPAIIIADYGRGRVLVSSGHAELTEKDASWLRRYIDWAGRRK